MHGYPEGYTQVSGPFIQPLGLDGEHFKLKITYEYKNTDDNGCWVTWRRGAILKFKAEDLPSHSVDDTLIHKDLGRLLRLDVPDPDVLQLKGLLSTQLSRIQRGEATQESLEQFCQDAKVLLK